MDIVYLIIFFILGTLMGSFFTVVGSRLPRREDFIKSRSHCDNCTHELSLLDMVPIISYLFLRGRCRYCGTKISPLSSYMEFFTGILFDNYKTALSQTGENRNEKEIRDTYKNFIAILLILLGTTMNFEVLNC